MMIITQPRSDLVHYVQKQSSLASCSFVKHGLILIILGNQPDSTLSEIICIFYFPCPSTFTYFICF